MLPWRLRSGLPEMGSTVYNAARGLEKQDAVDPVSANFGRTVTNDKTPDYRVGFDRTASPGLGKSIYQPLWRDQSKAGASAGPMTLPSWFPVYAGGPKESVRMGRVPTKDGRSQMP